MIHLICGQNAFTAQERVRELQKQYAASRPNSSISSFTEENFSADAFEHALRSTGLFGEQRIVIAKNILSSAEGRRVFWALAPLLQKSDAVLIVQESSLTTDVKKKAEKLLTKTELEEYPDFTKQKLVSWTQTQAKERRLTLTKEEAGALIRACGENPWAIIHALELRTLGMQHASTLKKNEKSIFKLLDAVTEKRPHEAFMLYHEILAEGASIGDIFWKLYWQYKNILVVSAYKHLSPSAIAEKTKLHPFVIKKAGWALERFTKQEIESTFEWLITLWQDDKIKTRDLPGELELFMLTLRPHILRSRFL
ncbi:MAG: hypothetical protein COU47_02200 [Candidatus Niyogibacteria bacterium CG10_big_fil_rev_8_21_14_0_10_46_36]|uniref:DNA polymerase III subunit delta n=1 Tax=Candidatus Niyogibacteria bacterium CG10_big_fil_rev_8_21_14_0_10_46_36 TaxID=1974726 RepID=A0A2H0TDC0_9BACT|nr:MAG: hypothetical protein COU47_02200 [Candidatus Niyogibacteria bacterium CG10_big_fil_rev_8_21_14_0_10_46_36]